MAFMNLKSPSIRLNCIELINRILKNIKKDYIYENLVLIKNLYKDLNENSLKREIIAILGNFYTEMGIEPFWRIFSEISNKTILNTLLNNFPRDDYRTPIEANIVNIHTEIPEPTDKQQQEINFNNFKHKEPKEIREKGKYNVIKQRFRKEEFFF